MEWLECYSKEDIACAQKADAHVSLVHGWIRDSLRPSNEELKSHASEVRILMSRRRTLKVQDDVLYKESINKVGRKFLQIVLPVALRHDVIHSLHDLKVVGHLGIQRTILRIKQRFYWPGLALDVARWCTKCDKCQGRKGKPHPS